MPTQPSRRQPLSQGARIPLGITLDPECYALLNALAKATAHGNRSAVIERLIRQSIAAAAPAP